MALELTSDENGRYSFKGVPTPADAAKWKFSRGEGYATDGTLTDRATGKVYQLNVGRDEAGQEAFNSLESQLTAAGTDRFGIIVADMTPAAAANYQKLSDAEKAQLTERGKFRRGTADLNQALDPAIGGGNGSFASADSIISGYDTAKKTQDANYGKNSGGVVGNFLSEMGKNPITAIGGPALAFAGAAGLSLGAPGAVAEGALAPGLDISSGGALFEGESAVAGGTAQSGIVNNALTKAGIGAVTHPDDPLRGALTGALGSIAGGMTPELATSIANGTELSPEVSRAIASSLTSGGVAAVTGGNPVTSAALGGADSVAAGALNDAGVDSTTGRALISGGNALATGGNPIAAAAGSVAGSVGGGLVNNALNGTPSQPPSDVANGADPYGGDTQAAANDLNTAAGSSTPVQTSEPGTIGMTPAQQASQWTTGPVTVGSQSGASAAPVTAPSGSSTPGIGFAPAQFGAEPTGAPLTHLDDGSQVWGAGRKLNVGLINRAGA